MESVLVTGGTGTLGRRLVQRLSANGDRVRVLSRRVGAADGNGNGNGTHSYTAGDLVTGRGLADAVEGINTIVHCATTNGRGDIAATQQLVDAVRAAGGTAHLIFVSIVGIEEIPLPYYRAKLAAEEVVADSGLPWTIQRTTQFHDLVASLFAWQLRMPVTLAVKDVRFQPIDTRDVAGRLLDLATAGPVGRAPDIGGPQVQHMHELARTYAEVYDRRRRIVSLRLPGKVARGFAQGHNLVPQSRAGTIGFADFLATEVQGPGR